MVFDWKKTLLQGLLIWVIMFAVVSAFIGFKLYDHSWAKYAIVVITAVVAYLFAASLKPAGLVKALLAGVLWLAVAVVLDFVVTRQFNPDIFSARSLWVSYAVTVLAPPAWVVLRRIRAARTAAAQVPV